MLWHSLKLTVFTTALLIVSGCNGFTVGSLNNRVDTKINSVAVIDAVGRTGQIYNRALRRALYIQGQTNSAYNLKSEISVSSSSALSVTGLDSTFKKMTMVAKFELKKQGSDEVLLSDSVTADATIGTVSSLFSQDQSNAHARDRIAKLLAQRVVQRLQLYFLENSDT